MQTIGLYIKNLRENQGLSIRKLACIAKVAHTELNKIENGTRKKPSPINLKKLADALNVSQTELFRVAGYIDEPLSPNCIFKNCENLSKTDIEYIQRFIDFIIINKEHNHE